MQKANASSTVNRASICLNIMIIGPTKSGKSSLFNYYTQNGMTPFYEEAHGVTFSSKIIELNEKKLKVQFWDLSNTNISRNVLTTYYKSAHGFFLLYDITDEESYRELSSFVENVKGLTAQNVPVMLLGNKSDRKIERSIPEIRAETFGKKANFLFAEISAREKTNLDIVFTTLLQEIIRKRETYDQEISPFKRIAYISNEEKLFELQAYSDLSAENSIFICSNISETQVLNKKFESIFVAIQMLTKLAKILSIPVILTEVNMTESARGDPPAVAILEILGDDCPKIAHESFSAFGKELQDLLYKEQKRKNIFLFGCEAHITIQQTNYDLIKQGFHTAIVVDAISSYNNGDRVVALSRMQQIGARIYTLESLIFEILRDAKNPKFKDCLKVLKTERPSQIDFSN